MTNVFLVKAEMQFDVKFEKRKTYIIHKHAQQENPF